VEELAAIQAVDSSVCHGSEENTNKKVHNLLIDSLLSINVKAVKRFLIQV